MMPRLFPATALLLSATAALLTSCRKPEIRVYLAPKDPPPTVQHTADDGHDHSAPAAKRPMPRVTWSVPPDWQPGPENEVSVASFAVKNASGEGKVTITPLPNLEGQEALVVNMYRQQAGLPPIGQEEVAGMLKPVEVAGRAGQLLELDGLSGNKPVRIVTAISHRDGQSWYFRLAGDQALVAGQRAEFLEFVKTARIEAGEEAPAPAPATAKQEPDFQWPLPQGWTQLAPGQMQIAKFAVPERDGAKAEVSVSTFPSDTGGTLANVNRWRKQLGLAEVDDAGLAALVAPLDPNAPNAQLVTLANESRALLGAIVPRGSQWWFYKMMGDAAAVSAERDSFVTFAKAQP